MAIKIIKSVFMLIIDLFCIIIIWFSATSVWNSTYARKRMEYEYVTAMSFTGEKSLELEGSAPPGIYDEIPMKEEQKPDCWFYEVRSQEEWDYFKSLIGIEDEGCDLDFLNNYYVFSISRELTALYYNNNVNWDIDEYGSLVRADFDLDNYEENMLYVYRLDEKITFFFNQRDYDLGNYNMSSGQLNILQDEPYEPYIYYPYPDQTE